MKKRLGLFEIVNGIILSLLMIVCLYPFLYVIFASFSDPWELVKHKGLLVAPLGFSLEGYKAVFSNRSILTGYITSVVNLVAGTSLNLILTLLAAYAVSRKDFLLKRPIVILIVFTMFFNSGIIPRFLVVKSMGLYDSRLSMILPTAINVFNLVIMRTAIENLPDSLEEAAVLEGANDFDILFKIVAPLIKSTIAVLVLYYGVAHWNQWYQALMYIQTREKYPLQLVLREILIGNSTESMAAGGVDSSGTSAVIGEVIKYATIVVSTVPILSIYPLLQKHFVKGVMVGAVKG
ncbi:ABC transporter permease subunit [Clostridium sp. MCC353]|uniref:carbohydrate ABC transporter permease n=1 Tax=Clostridium sp. MCC353 TaxID=2592646 RepID=UPI001C01C310|nr:carbohydrate ABC transporter permease [Clostridium sp. MCC353]MBT9775623.1 ABC transporter permease subunit [Clostridium sp. MCC353]